MKRLQIWFVQTWLGRMVWSTYNPLNHDYSMKLLTYTLPIMGVRAVVRSFRHV